MLEDAETAGADRHQVEPLPGFVLGGVERE